MSTTSHIALFIIMQLGIIPAYRMTDYITTHNEAIEQHAPRVTPKASQQSTVDYNSSRSNK